MLIATVIAAAALTIGLAPSPQNAAPTSSALDRLRRRLHLPEGTLLAWWPDQTFRTLYWKGDQVEPLRKTFREFAAGESIMREMELQKTLRLTATLDFKGGTLGSYIDALVQHFALPKPVFDPPELRNVTMPAVQLNRLDLASAFSLPASLSLLDESKNPIRVRTAWVGPGADPSPSSVQGPRSDKPLSDYRQSVCIVARVADKSLPSNPETHRAVFNLIGEKGALSAGQLRTIMEAIQMAIDMDGHSSTFKAKFHEPSGLLILQGTDEELGVAAQVVRAKLPQARIELPGAIANSQQNPPVLSDIPIVDYRFNRPGKP